MLGSKQEEYCNHESISKHHTGVNVMLAHFHYLNKGVLPFRLTYDAAGIRELSKAAELDPEQVTFIKRTSRLLDEPQRCELLRNGLGGVWSGF